MAAFWWINDQPNPEDYENSGAQKQEEKFGFAEVNFYWFCFHIYVVGNQTQRKE